MVYLMHLQGSHFIAYEYFVFVSFNAVVTNQEKKIINDEITFHSVHMRSNVV